MVYWYKLILRLPNGESVGVWQHQSEIAIMFIANIRCHLITMAAFVDSLGVGLWLGILSRDVWAFLVIKFKLHCSDCFTIKNYNLSKWDFNWSETTYTLYMPDPGEELKVKYSNISSSSTASPDGCEVEPPQYCLSIQDCTSIRQQRNPLQ
jgi:hypothetical protein